MDNNNNSKIYRVIESELAKKLYQLEQLRKIYDATDMNYPHEQVQASVNIAKVAVEVAQIEKTYARIRKVMGD